MSKLLHYFKPVGDKFSALGIYMLLLIVNAFSQSSYVKVEQKNMSNKG